MKEKNGSCSVEMTFTKECSHKIEQRQQQQQMATQQQQTKLKESVWQQFHSLEETLFGL